MGRRRGKPSREADKSGLRSHARCRRRRRCHCCARGYSAWGRANAAAATAAARAGVPGGVPWLRRGRRCRCGGRRHLPANLTWFARFANIAASQTTMRCESKGDVQGCNETGGGGGGRVDDGANDG